MNADATAESLRWRPLLAPRARARIGVTFGRAGALLALCATLRVVSLFRPVLSDDEATYAVVAREMLHGRALYRDVVDHKPPAVYVTYAAAEAVGGLRGGMILLHGLLIFVVWATGLLLALLVRRADPEGHTDTPFFASLLWVVFTTTHFDVDSLAANCELLMMLPLVASVVLFVGARGRAWWLVASGGLVGIAMLYKYQAGVQLPLYACVLIGQEWRRPARVIVRGLALAGGVAVPLAAALLVLWAAGALPDALFWFKFNFAYIHTGFSLTETLSRLVVRGSFVVLSAALLYAFGVRAALSRSPRGLPIVPLRSFARGWLVVSAIAVMCGGRFFGHYFHQLTAPLAVLAAPLAVALYERRPRLFAGAIGLPTLTFWLAGLAHGPIMRMAGDADPDYGQVAGYLEAHSRPDDSICVWGNSPGVYFETDRPLGCRFVFANYLTGLSPATKTQSDPSFDASANVVPESWDMLDEDLANRRPLFIIDASPGNVGHYGKFPPAHFPRLQAVLRANYVVVAEVQGMAIWRRQSLD